MKKYIHLFFLILFIYSIFSSNFSFAGEVKVSQQTPLPEYSKIGPQVVPKVHPLSSQKLNPNSNKILEESAVPISKDIVIEPIQKAPESKNALVAGTSGDIPCYEKINLSKAIDYAMTHNIDIKGDKLNIDIAKNNIKVANRLRNPSFISFYNLGRAATDNPNSVGLMFPIEIAKRGPRKNLAKSNFELIKGNVLLAELNLRLDVRQAYVDLVAAKSTLRILNDQRKLLQELLYVAQKKYDAGAVPEMDVIHTKMTLNQLLIQVNSANTDVYVARYKFNTFLDPFHCNYDTVEDYLPEQNEFISMLTPKPTEKMPSFDDVLNIALEKRLDLKNAQRDIEVAQKNLIVTIRQRVPDIELGGGYLFVPQALATDNQFSQGVFAIGNITNIPLLYQYSPEIKNAKLQLEQKELAYKSLKHDDTLALHSAYDEFNTARDNLNYYSDVLLAESKQFLNMAKRSYVVGKSSITDFIFIQQSYKTIMMGYTMALADYYDAWVEILRQVNDEELKLNG